MYFSAEWALSKCTLVTGKRRSTRNTAQMLGNCLAFMLSSVAWSDVGNAFWSLGPVQNLFHSQTSCLKDIGAGISAPKLDSMSSILSSVQDAFTLFGIKQKPRTAWHDTSLNLSDNSEISPSTVSRTRRWFFPVDLSTSVFPRHISTKRLPPCDPGHGYISNSGKPCHLDTLGEDTVKLLIRSCSDCTNFVD